MRIIAIILNALVLVFIAWMSIESLRFARSVDMPLPQSIGVLVGRWIFVGFTTIPTLAALLREQPRIEVYAIIVNIVLCCALAIALVVLAFVMLLPGTDYKLVLVAVIPAIGFALPIIFNLIVLRQRRAVRLQKLAVPTL